MSNGIIQPIISTSINQILNLTTSDQNLVIHRHGINKVCIVGCLIRKENLINYFKLTINDYTGIIQVVVWKNSDDFDMPDLVEHSYVKIIGHPRFNNSAHSEKLGIHVSALNVEPIINLNEITIHLLEVVKHCKDLKRLRYNFRSNAKINCNVTKTEQNLPHIYGLDRFETLIFNVVKEDSSEKGLTFEAIFQKVKSIGEVKAKEAFISLIKEEHIFEKDGFYKAFY